jgi:hypothetical protein
MCSLLCKFAISRTTVQIFFSMIMYPRTLGSVGRKTTFFKSTRVPPIKIQDATPSRILHASRTCACARCVSNCWVIDVVGLYALPSDYISRGQRRRTSEPRRTATRLDPRLPTHCPPVLAAMRLYVAADWKWVLSHTGKCFWHWSCLLRCLSGCSCLETHLVVSRVRPGRVPVYRGKIDDSCLCRVGVHPLLLIYFGGFGGPPLALLPVLGWPSPKAAPPTPFGVLRGGRGSPGDHSVGTVWTSR